MSKEKCIYIVTHGCYSDYGITGVFDNEELAKAYQKLYEFDQVEEWELNEYAEFIRKGLACWIVWFNHDGSVHHITRVPFGFDGLNKLVFSRVYDGYGGMTSMLAKDAEHAGKIYSERRAAVVMANRWPSIEEIEQSHKLEVDIRQ